MPTLAHLSLGLQPYAKVLEYQQRLRTQRQAGEIPDTILTVEHPKVITQGRRPAKSHYRVPPLKLKQQGFAIHQVKRGGYLTYHGPGQLVVYFIISLTERKLSIPQFVTFVEESVLKTLKYFKVLGKRRKGCPGVWVQTDSATCGYSKIASLGLSIDQGVSMHGVAINVDPALEDFKVIIPCGMPECEVTSMVRELGEGITLKEVEVVLLRSVRDVFDRRLG